MALQTHDPSRAVILSVGNVQSGGTTNYSKPVITGTADAGNVVVVYDGIKALGSVLAEPDGRWTFTPAIDLKAGAHKFTAVSHDSEGNFGASSEPVSVTIAQVAVVPAAPEITALMDATGPVTGQIINGTTTDDSRPALSGTGAPGNVIKLYDGSALIGSTTVAPDGTWSVQPLTALSDGPHGLYATQTSSTGTSGPSTGISFKIDTWFPAKPAAPDVTDGNGGLIPAGSTTSDAHPHISGTGTAGNMIVVYDGTIAIGSALIGADGKWSFTPATDLSKALHTIIVTETNPAGATGPRSDGVSFIVDSGVPVDTTVPPRPVITSATDAVGPVTGLIPANGMTYDPRPTFAGTAKAGDIVTLYDAGRLIGSAKADPDGKWSFKPTMDLTNGTHSICATETNAAGTTGPMSDRFEFTIDTYAKAPSTKTAITGLYDDTSGSLVLVANGDATRDTTPILMGSLSSALLPGEQLAVQRNGVKVGYATVSGTTWTFNEVGVPVGSHTYRVRVESNAGASLFSPYYAFTVEPLVMATTADVVAALPDPIPTAESHLVKSILPGATHPDATSEDALNPVTSGATGIALHPAVGGEHDVFKGAASHDAAGLNVDPAAQSNETTAHIESSTLHLTGDHQTLDLTSLTGKVAAAKLSGVQIIDLDGQHNMLKLSLVDVLNLGETDLFRKDGKQQMMVKGAQGDEVDLSNARIAGLTDGEWQQHGTAQVGGVTYNVYEYSGVQAELLVQQGVQIATH